MAPLKKLGELNQLQESAAKCQCENFRSRLLARCKRQKNVYRINSSASIVVKKSIVWEWESIGYIIDYRTFALMELQNSECCSLQSAKCSLAISRQFPSLLLPAQEGCVFFFLFWPSFDTQLKDVAWLLKFPCHWIAVLSMHLMPDVVLGGIMSFPRTKRGRGERGRAGRNARQPWVGIQWRADDNYARKFCAAVIHFY